MKVSPQTTLLPISLTWQITKEILWMIRNRSRQIPLPIKRIDSEKWNILLPVSEDMAKQLKDNEYIKIRFCKDDFTLTVPYSLTKKDESYYVNLSLKTAMIRYVNDRFVDVELVVSEKPV